MPLGDEQLAAYVLRVQATTNLLAARTAEQVGLLWDVHGGLDDAALETFSATAASTVRAAQTTAAGLAVGYVRNYVAAATGTTPDVELDPAEVAAQARPVPPEVVYQRPVIAARTAIAAGRSFEQAMRAGRNRATSSADTDVALANRRGTFDAMERVGGPLRFYRRVPSRGACTFCKVASTQRYHRGDLMPLHSHCHCAIAPIIANRDPGRVINKDLLEQLQAAAGRPDYWNDPKAAVAVEQHGELGPVLVHRGDHFTGPGAIAA